MTGRRSDSEIPEAEFTESFIRASGPGGQNVNKVATAVQLRFDISASASLTPFQKQQLRKLASHLLTKDDELVIEASSYRTQSQNREDARVRLGELVAEARKPPPKKRKKTRPPKSAVEKRLRTKTGRGRIKQLRGRVRDE